MSYKTNPLALRLNHNVGWKTTIFPTKNYTHTILLWLRIYLFLKGYLFLRNYKLLSCELKYGEKFEKILYITVLKTNKKKKIYKSMGRLQTMKNQIVINHLYNLYFLYNTHHKKTSLYTLKNWLQLNYPKYHLLPRTNLWWYKNLKYFRRQQIRSDSILYTRLSTFNNKKARSYESIKNRKHKIVQHKIKNLLIYKLGSIRKKAAKLQYLYAVNKAFKNLFKMQTFAKPYPSDLNFVKQITKHFWRAKIYTTSINKSVKKLKKQVHHLNKVLALSYNKKQRHTSFWKKSLKKKIIDETIPLLNKALIKTTVTKKAGRIWHTTNWSFLVRDRIKMLKLLRSTLIEHPTIASYNLIKHLYLIKKKIIGKKRKKTLSQPKLKKHIKSQFKRKVGARIKTRTKVKRRRKIWTKVRAKIRKILYKRRTLRKLKKKKILFKFAKQCKTGIASSYKKNYPNLMKLSNKFVRNTKKAKWKKKRSIIQLSRITAKFQLKYHVQNFIKKYFLVSAEVHIFQPLRHYKNLKWYRFSKSRAAGKNKKISKLKKNKNLSRTIPYTLFSKSSKLRKIIYLTCANKKYLKKRDYGWLNLAGWQTKALLIRFLPLFSIFSTYLDPQLLTDQIAKEFEKTKNHRALYYNLKTILHLLNMNQVLNFRVGIYGRFNSSTRSQKKYLTYGFLPINFYDDRISYALSHSYARIGCFGIRLWLKY